MKPASRTEPGPASGRAGGGVLVELQGVGKRFPGVRALQDIDLAIRGGEVHALTGENGSGKSTLSRIIAGLLRPDGGRILIDGVDIHMSGPSDALKHGIAMISQELTLAPTLSVAENIFLGRLPRRPSGMVAWKRLEEDAEAVLRRLNVHVSPRAKVSRLSVELRQEIEIARALSLRPRLLILDEATSSLSEAAAARLLALVDEERDAGAAILMITHRMPEIFAVADVTTILRDGKRVATKAIDSTDEADLVRLMVGRDINDYYGRRQGRKGETVLAIDALRCPGRTLRATSLTIRRGEIYGVAGLVGSGKVEFGQALGGAVRAEGRVEVDGRPMRLGNPRHAIDAGIGFVPDDRKAAALLLVRSVSENFAVAWMDALSRLGVLNLARERREVCRAIERYRVVTPSPATPISALSGGNQQKVVLGRAFWRRPKVWVLCEPTRGIDVGARSEIYRLFQDAAADGAAIIVISSELPELLGLCDRIGVFFEGRLEAEFDRRDASEEAIAHVAVAGRGRVDGECCMDGALQ